MQISRRVDRQKDDYKHQLSSNNNSLKKSDKAENQKIVSKKAAAYNIHKINLVIPTTLERLNNNNAMNLGMNLAIPVKNRYIFAQQKLKLKPISKNNITAKKKIKDDLITNQIKNHQICLSIGKSENMKHTKKQILLPLPKMNTINLLHQSQIRRKQFQKQTSSSKKNIQNKNNQRLPNKQKKDGQQTIKNILSYKDNIIVKEFNQLKIKEESRPKQYINNEQDNYQKFIKQFNSFLCEIKQLLKFRMIYQSYPFHLFEQDLLNQKIYEFSLNEINQILMAAPFSLSQDQSLSLVQHIGINFANSLTRQQFRQQMTQFLVQFDMFETEQINNILFKLAVISSTYADEIMKLLKEHQQSDGIISLQGLEIVLKQMSFESQEINLIAALVSTKVFSMKKIPYSLLFRQIFSLQDAGLQTYEQQSYN